VELRQLRHFVTVAEELHFGRASERLGMTQPPLSQSIIRLEAELGVRLFTRSHRNVELTPVGKQWLPHVQRVLGDANGLPALARQLLRGETGSLALAFVSTADYGILPRLLSEYGVRYPDVAVELREATSDVQIEAILGERIDAGIVIASDGIEHPALTYLPMTRERLVVAIPDAWIGTGRLGPTPGPIGLAAIVENPLLIFPRRIAPTLHDAITGCYASEGISPRFGQEAIQMQTIISLVSAGLGVALVPESLRNLQRRGVAYLELETASPEIETGLLWRRRNASPTLRRFVEIARVMGLDLTPRTAD
jgi:DNA-binding transcriptional LysR family regulator